MERKIIWNENLKCWGWWSFSRRAERDGRNAWLFIKCDAPKA